MLTTLTVSDFVLIDGLVLELDSGLNVLTGETGAGKSILVDALGLVLGGRARPEVVRTGCAHAEVEACFELAPEHTVWKALEESGLPQGDGELVIRRTVTASGRSKAYVNGKSVTAGQLASLAAGLVDIASQHESQSLCDPNTHLTLLDAYAGLEDHRAQLSAIVTELLAAVDERKAIVSAEQAARQREDFLRFQLAEIDELSLQPGEVATLDAERKVLKNADVLAQAARASLERLDDSEASVLELLRKAHSDLDRASVVDARLETFAQTLDSVTHELDELVRGLSRYRESVEADPDRLAEIDERLFKIQRMLRRYGPDEASALQKRAEIEAELATLSQSGSRVEQLSARIEALTHQAGQLAHSLSIARKKAADSLGAAIAGQLASLSMGKAKIVVEVAPLDALGEGLQIATAEGPARLSRGGVDRVEMLIAPNVGEDPRPLRKIASGGELSRALLAIKRVLANNAPKGLYVFDEVDAGVGGAVAESIGRKIADVGRHHQVLCITHLAQIAMFGEAHFVVRKVETDGRTRSQVERLTESARIDELARMVGGASVTATTRKMAAEMRKTAKLAAPAS